MQEGPVGLGERVFTQPVRLLDNFAREILPAEPQRDVHQTDEHRHLDERPDDRGKSHARGDAEDGDGHGDGQLEIVACRGEGQRGAAGVVRPDPPPEEKADPKHEDKINGQRHRDAQHVERQLHDGVPLEGEHDNNGEEQGDQRDRGNDRNEFVVIPIAPFERDENDATQHPRGERDPEVNHHAGEDLSDGHIGQRFPTEPLHAGQVDAEQTRQPGDEDPRVETEGHNLEDAVERDQTGAVFAVALGQVVPNEDHGDAAGDAHEDEADHVVRVIAEKKDRQDKHQDRTNHPVLQQRQPDDLRVGENLGHLLVAHLGQGRIHHEDQARGNEQIGRADRDRREEGFRVGNQEIPRQHPRRHGDENPQCEVTVQKGHPAGDRVGHERAEAERRRGARAWRTQDGLSGPRFFFSLVSRT